MSMWGMGVFSAVNQAMSLLARRFVLLILANIQSHRIPVAWLRNFCLLLVQGLESKSYRNLTVFSESKIHTAHYRLHMTSMGTSP
jgi:hypothetical protein